MSEKYIAVELNGIVEIHAHGNGAADYYTLCGLDGDDPSLSVAQMVKAVPKGAKITCQQCASIIRQARRYTERDIDL